MIVEPIQNKNEVCEVCGKEANVSVSSKNSKSYYMCKECLSEAPVLLIQTRQKLRAIVNQFKSKTNKG